MLLDVLKYFNCIYEKWDLAAIEERLTSSFRFDTCSTLLAAGRACKLGPMPYIGVAPEPRCDKVTAMQLKERVHIKNLFNQADPRIVQDT